jgi:hypothetical protein
MIWRHQQALANAEFAMHLAKHRKTGLAFVDER